MSEKYTTGEEKFCLGEHPEYSPNLDLSSLRKLYLHYEICADDPARAGGVLDEMIRRGDAEAMFRRALELSANANPADDQEAVRMMEKAAAQGYEDAQRSMESWRKDGIF